MGAASHGARPSGERWSGGASQPPIPRLPPVGSVHHNRLLEFVSWACPGFFFFFLNELALSSLPNNYHHTKFGEEWEREVGVGKLTGNPTGQRGESQQQRLRERTLEDAV